jgi:hypothetical protein
VLLYQDSLAQLWGRAERYDDPKSAYYLEPRHREVGEFVQQGFVYWPAIPKYKPTVPVEGEPKAVAGGTSRSPNSNL